MTDNGSYYRAFTFRDACREENLKHIRTRPCTPKTNGKAERFIQTALRNGPTPKPLQTIEPPHARLAAPIQPASAPRRRKIPDTISRLDLIQDKLLRLHNS
jgi:transposase InsO family protein